MEEDIIKWQGYEWLNRERWGRVHPGKPDAWNDPSAVKIDDDGFLRLYTHKNTKIFHDEKGEEVISNVGIGLVSCTNEFSYGLFEIEAKLPKGPYVWPAFWCWSFDSWPPEIDMIEGYSNKRGSYFNWTYEALIGKWWKVESNIHLKEKVKKSKSAGDDVNRTWNLGGKPGWLGFKSPSKRFNKYGLLWTPTEISILFNGKKVRTIKDPNVMKQMENVKMNIIINNSIQSDYLKTDMPTSEMIIKNFKYKKL